MQAELSPITKQTTQQAVNRALQKYIINNNLKPGNPLPTEHELSENLNVSRSVVREALQNFKALGIIESKPRTGARIKRLYPENVFENYLPFMLNDKELLAELEQARKVMEIGLAFMVVDNATDEDLKELKEIAEKMCGASHKKLIELDNEFHSKMLQISGNRILVSLRPMINEYFYELENINSKPSKEKIEKVIRGHIDIIEAIESRDLNNVVESIKRHYTAFCDSVN